MAAGVRRVLGADVGLAVTGVAGPAEQDGQPVGTVSSASRSTTTSSRCVQCPVTDDGSASSPRSPRSTCSAGDCSLAAAERLGAAVRRGVAVRCRVGSARGAGSPVIDGVRWTTRDQWHITLRFFGEVEDASVSSGVGTRCSLVGRACEVVGRVCGSATCCGRPWRDSTTSRGRGRRNGVVRRGPDDRPFRGHITLARQRSRREESALRSAQGQPLSGGGTCVTSSSCAATWERVARVRDHRFRVRLPGG